MPHFRLIVTDGVFSMDGNVCPLPQIKQLADRSNLLLGVLRQTKRRTPTKSSILFDKSIMAGMELQSSLTSATQLDSLEKLVAEPRYIDSLICSVIFCVFLFWSQNRGTSASQFYISLCPSPFYIITMHC